MEESYKGNDRLIFGIGVGILTYWLFSQALLNTVPDVQQDLAINTNIIGIGISATSLFFGIFVVVAGGFVDRYGAVRITMIGLVLSVIGSILLVISTGSIMFISGRIIQGLSAACIMPSTLSLIKSYYKDEQRQRALSFWAIGSWGGTGLCSLVGGAIASSIGWRWIFVFSIVFALFSIFLIKGTPETKVVASSSTKKFDFAGLMVFIISMVSLNIIITQGSKLGWTSISTLILGILCIVSAILFFQFELKKKDKSFIDFSIFKNKAYSGATLSNFLLNSAAGTLIVINTYIQLSRGFSAFETGLLSIGYLVCILIMIRVGEKALQKIGARKPMMLGAFISALGITLMALTFLSNSLYIVFVIIGFILFGTGLGFYATPSTDTAVSNSPEGKAGVATGIYKMSSALGGSLGIAISSSVFSALNVQGNIDFAAMIGLSVSIVSCLLALLSVFITTPKDVKTV